MNKDKIFKKSDGKMRERYIKVMYEMLNYYDMNRTRYRYHFKKWTGRFRHLSLVDKESYAIDLLKFYKLKYTKGNDAKKGGVIGDYIEISSRAYTKLKNIYEKEA